LRIDFLWFDECPSHEGARQLLADVLKSRNLDEVFNDLNASSPEDAEQLRFPGSPTIRVDGIDIEPDFVDPGDYTPRCRLYYTKAGLSGKPDRVWIEEAIDRALKS
jgi:hypothetical protein